MPKVSTTGMFVSVNCMYAHHDAAVGPEFVIAKVQRGPVSRIPVSLVRVQNVPVRPSERILRVGMGAGPDENIQQSATTNTTPTKINRTRFTQLPSSMFGLKWCGEG